MGYNQDMNSKIFNILTGDIKSAMLSKDNIKRDCLRTIVSEIKNQTVNAGKEITDDICLKVIQKSAKQHADSIENFKSGNRQDLVEKEQIELNIINGYLPKMLSEDETNDEIRKIISSGVDPVKKNMGTIMKSLPKNVDRKLASSILSNILK